MARKNSEPKKDYEYFDKQRQSFIITGGESLMGSYGPVDPDWDGKPVTLKSIIDEWTKPDPDRHAGLTRGDVAVWHEGKLVAIMREFATNQYDVLVLDYGLLNQKRPKFLPKA